MSINGRNLLITTTALLLVAFQTSLCRASAAETEAVAGLYVGKSFAGGGPYKVLGHHFNEQYLYLAPGGTFYEGYGSSGYDQMEKTDDVKTGRYLVQSDAVALRYTDGSEQAIGREGDTLNYGDVGRATRQPNCDGFKLDGTYQPAGLATGIAFTPDGRFVDRGIVAGLTETKLVGLRMYKDEPRPGPGTYNIKNHTLTLQYANGHVTRLFFYIHGNARGDMDFGTIHVNRTLLVRQGGGSFAGAPSTPVVRLPKIEAPPGWKSQRDHVEKRTNLVPSDLPRNRAAAVAITDPQRLPNPDVARFPSQFHDRAVQETVKNYVSQGWRVERAMSRETHGHTPASTGVFILPDGKQWWVTVAHLLSSTEWQFFLFMSDGEDLHKAYLPAVRAMLGNGSPPPPDRTAGLSTSSPGPLRVTLPSHWKAEYNPTEKITTFLPPEVPVGRTVLVQIADSEQTTSSAGPFHDEAVQEMIASLKDGRLEGPITREDFKTVASSTGVFMNQHGKRVWVTVFTAVSGTEGSGGVLLTDGEDLHKQYLQPVQTMFAEVAGQSNKD
ncbi:MAG: hypothetical protein P0111_10550 [Nitrospira sp.]|nr:hypothetical protein [Nitrospira sp.]